MRDVGFGMRPHDFHRQALATGLVDVMLTFSDFNLLRQAAAEPGGILEAAATRDVGVLNGFSIMRGILTGADVDEAAAKGRFRNEEDIARARTMRRWAIDRGSACWRSRCSSACADERVHGNPLGNQNVGDLEQNVAAGLDAAAGGHPGGLPRRPRCSPGALSRAPRCRPGCTPPTWGRGESVRPPSCRRRPPGSLPGACRR